MSDDPLVFISHIVEEAELATLFQETIQGAFLGKIRFFQSTDSKSIRGGKKWLNEVTMALKTADIMLILASRRSIRRPWINFEAGAGWVREIQVIPLCHTDMKREDLPIPINMLQAFNASDKTHLEHLIGTIAETWNCTAPKIDYEALSEKITAFERRNGFARRIAASVHALCQLDPGLVPLFKASAAPRATATIRDVPSEALALMRPHLDLLMSEKMLRYRLEGGGILIFAGPPPASVASVILEVLESYYAIADEIQSEIAAP